MKILIKSISFLLLSILFIQCKKDNNRNSNSDKRYLVAYTINYSYDSAKTTYEYNSTGLVVRIGNISQYVYLDNVIKETVFDGQQNSYNYYYLNADGLVKTQHQFEYMADPIPQNILYRNEYKYDQNGYLSETDIYNQDTLIYKTSFIWKDGNLQQSIQQFMGNNHSVPYTATTNYDYYQDTLNCIAFGQDYLGKQSKNLLKRINAEGIGESGFTYEFDSEMRPVKRIEIRTHFKKNFQHSGDFLTDTIITGFGY